MKRPLSPPLHDGPGARAEGAVPREARAQWRKKPLKGEVRMHVTLYFGTKRRADWDNFHKLSCDALPHIEIAVAPL
jgi:Holliday junction resolvase RusA-like endonuclease